MINIFRVFVDHDFVTRQLVVISTLVEPNNVPFAWLALEFALKTQISSSFRQFLRHSNHTIREKQNQDMGILQYDLLKLELHFHIVHFPIFAI